MCACVRVCGVLTLTICNAMMRTAAQQNSNPPPPLLFIQYRGRGRGKFIVIVLPTFAGLKVTYNVLD